MLILNKKKLKAGDTFYSNKGLPNTRYKCHVLKIIDDYHIVSS